MLIFRRIWTSDFTIFFRSSNNGIDLRNLQSHIYFCDILVTMNSILLLSIFSSVKIPNTSVRLISLLAPNIQAKKLSFSCSVVGQLKNMCKAVSRSGSLFLVIRQTCNRVQHFPQNGQLHGCRSVYCYAV